MTGNVDCTIKGTAKQFFREAPKEIATNEQAYRVEQYEDSV
jgi:hypothetical protein